MPVALSIVGFLLLIILFVLIWTRSTGGRFIVTPLLLFGMFEIVSVWPATIFAQVSGDSLTGAFPALMAALAFGALLLGFVVMSAVGGCWSLQSGDVCDRRVNATDAECSY